MSILTSDLKWYFSTTYGDDDTATAIGGAIKTSTKPEFYSFAGLGQIVSSAGGDTTQTVTASFFTASGGTTVSTEVKTLNGTTPVLFTTTGVIEFLKAIKSATTTGDVAFENQTAERTNTAAAGGTDTITLDASASASDGFYRGMVIRLTAGTGSGQIRQVVAYNGTTKVATVSYAWGTPPDVTTTFRLAKGFVFEKSPNEILECRRPFFNASADVPGGVTKNYYEKIFAYNGHGTLSLTSSQVIELINPANDVTFGLPGATNDTGTNGGGNNRQVAPAGISFATTTQGVPGGGSLAPGDRIGVWLRRQLAAGAQATDLIFVPRLSGQTV